MKKLNKILIGFFISITLFTGVTYALTIGTLDSNFAPNRAGVPFTLEQSCNNNSDCSGGFACSQVSHRCTHPGFNYTTFNNFINNDRIPGTEAWDQDERKFLAGAYCPLSEQPCNLATDANPSLNIYNKIPHTADTIKVGDKVFFWIYFHNNGQSGNNGVAATSIDIGLKNLSVGQTENGIFTLKPTGYIDSSQTSEITDNMGIKLEQQNVKLVPQPKAFIVTRPDGQSTSKTWTSIEPGPAKNVNLHKTGNNFITTSATFSSSATGMSVHLTTLPGCFEYSGFALFSAVVEEIPNTCQSLAAPTVSSTYENVVGSTQYVHRIQVNDINFQYDPPMAGLRLKWTANSGTFYTKSGAVYTPRSNQYITSSLAQNQKTIYYVGNGPVTVAVVKNINGDIDNSVSNCHATIQVPPDVPVCTSMTNPPATIQTNQITDLGGINSHDQATRLFPGQIEYKFQNGATGLFYSSQATAQSNAGGQSPKQVNNTNPATHVFVKVTNAGGADGRIKIDTLNTGVGACTKYISTVEAPATCGIINVTKNQNPIYTNQVVEFSATANRPAPEGGGTFSGNINYSVPPDYDGYFYTSKSNAENSVADRVRNKTVSQGTPVYFKGAASGTDIITVDTLETGIQTCTQSFSVLATTCKQLYVLHNPKILSDTTSQFKAVSYDNIDTSMTNKIKYSLTGGASGSFYIVDPGSPQNPFTPLEWTPGTPPNLILGLGMDLVEEIIIFYNQNFVIDLSYTSFFETVVTKTQNFFAYIGDYTKASLLAAIGPQLPASSAIQAGLLDEPVGLQHGGLNTNLLDNLLIAGTTSLDNVDPETTVFFIGNGSGGQVKVETKGAEGTPSCNQLFPIVPAVCKTLAVQPVPPATALKNATDIEQGESVEFIAGSIWGESGPPDPAHVFYPNKTITYTVTPGKGHIYKTSTPANKVQTLTVNPGEHVTFIADGDIGTKVLTIDTDYTNQDACIKYYNVIAAPVQPSSCDHISPIITDTLEATVSGEYLLEGQPYTVSNITTYQNEANVPSNKKNTIYTVKNSTTEHDHHLVDFNNPSLEYQTKTLPNTDDKIYFFAGNVDENSDQEVLEIKDDFDGTNACKKTYKIKKGGPPSGPECHSLSLTKGSTTQNGNGKYNQPFTTTINADAGYSPTWSWYFYPSGGATGWESGNSHPGTNVLKNIDPTKTITGTVDAGNGCIAPFTLSPSTSGQTITKQVHNVTTPESPYQDQLVTVGAESDILQYRAIITNNGADQLSFKDKGFDGNGKIYGHYLMNDKTKNNTSPGYLEFIANNTVIKADGAPLSKCPTPPAPTGSIACYTPDLDSSFGIGQTVTLKNVGSKTSISIEYKVENHSITRDPNTCSASFLSTGCGEIFENNIILNPAGSSSSDTASATVIALCPYIITRGSGDVFFHNDIANSGADLTCINLQNSLGIIIKPKKYPVKISSTGGGDKDLSNTLETAKALATNSHDICKRSNTTDADLPDEYSNISPNFSSSVCEMQSDVSKVWREPIINKAIQNNADKLGRWTNVQAPSGATPIYSLMGNQGVVVINGNVTIPSGGLEIKAEVGKRPAGQTYIIRGNLTINGNINYIDSGTDYKDPRNIPSVAFIVIDGNIKISKDVQKLDGIYVALTTDPDTNSKGQINSDGSVSTKQLRVRGSLVGDVSDLFAKRKALGNPYKDEGAIAILYDERLILNTPPGLGNFLDLSQMKVPHKIN